MCLVGRASSITCRAQCKTKIWGSVSIKQKKNAINIKLFPLLQGLVVNWLWWFGFVFNDILSQEKLKIKVISPFFFVLCNASLPHMQNHWNYTIHISYFVQCTQTNSSVFISLLDTYTFTGSLPLATRRKELELWVTLSSSSFEVLILGVSGWLIQGRNTRKKEYDRISCLLVFFRIPFAFPLHLIQIQVWTQHMATGGCQGSLLPSHWLKAITFWLVWDHMPRGPTRNVCWWGIYSHAGSIIPPDFTYETQWKDKIKNFKVASGEH